MENRKFGNTGLTPSILGFGMMRLPKDANGKIDEEWAVRTLRKAIDNGQKVLYVTERCVFILTARGLKLLEVYPGVDVQRDILDLLPFDVET